MKSLYYLSQKKPRTSLYRAGVFSLSPKRLVFGTDGQRTQKDHEVQVPRTTCDGRTRSHPRDATHY